MSEPVQCGKCCAVRFDDVFPMGGVCDYIVNNEACGGTWGPLSRGRDTGFKDKHGVPIREGDLVVTRERGYRWRRLSVWVWRYFSHRIHNWFNHLGRRNGRTWLGVVVPDMDNWAVRPTEPRWAFRSVNMGATIWEYWADQLEVVYLPEEAIKIGETSILKDTNRR